MIYNPFQKAVFSGSLHDSRGKTAGHNKDTGLDSDVPSWDMQN